MDSIAFFTIPISSFNRTVSEFRNQSFYKTLSAAEKLAYMQAVADRLTTRSMNLTERREHEMAKKTKNNGFTTKFASISLDEEAKKIAKKWIQENAHDAETYWAELNRGGWKISSTFDDENDCFIVSATQREEGNRNFDVCVSSRSDNPVEALLLTAYKIFVMFKGEKIPTERPKENWG